MITANWPRLFDYSTRSPSIAYIGIVYITIIYYNTYKPSRSTTLYTTLPTSIVDLLDLFYLSKLCEGWNSVLSIFMGLRLSGPEPRINPLLGYPHAGRSVRADLVALLAGGDWWYLSADFIQ